MPFPEPRIAIIGGGPAGLTTGVLLHKQGVPFTIYELRQRPTNAELAKPSGSLDLHEESGLAALRECGLYDDFLQYTGECAEADKISDKDGNILHADDGQQSQRPEISRHNLTKLLLSHLPADCIKWEHKLFSATTIATPTGTETELDFGPHGKQSFDLVIGADGAWSRIRNLLTDVKPYYAGRQCVTLTIRNLSSKFPHLAELVGVGTFAALGNRHGVMSQRGPQDSARIYIMLTTDDESFPATSGLAARTAAQSKDILLKDHALLGSWGPKLKELLTVALDEESADNPNAPIDIKPLYMLPIGHSWEHKANATVIGDAAHLMCPWAGEGVNLAMWDSLLLCRAIIKAYEGSTQDIKFQDVLDPLMKDFEKDLVTRSEEKAQETYNNGEMMFGEDGAKAFAAFFESMGPPPA